MRYLVLLLALAGCSSTVVLDRELPKLVGQPVDVAVAKFGMPTSEQTIIGQRVYVWSNSEQDVSLAPAIGSRGAVGLLPVATQGTCVVRVQVDAGGIVRRAEHQGDPDACYRYSDRLKR